MMSKEFQELVTATKDLVLENLNVFDFTPEELKLFNVCVDTVRTLEDDPFMMDIFKVDYENVVLSLLTFFSKTAGELVVARFFPSMYYGQQLDLDLVEVLRRTSIIDYTIRLFINEQRTREDIADIEKSYVYLNGYRLSLYCQAIDTKIDLLRYIIERLRSNDDVRKIAWRILETEPCYQQDQWKSLHDADRYEYDLDKYQYTNSLYLNNTSMVLNLNVCAIPKRTIKLLVNAASRSVDLEIACATYAEESNHPGERVFFKFVEECSKDPEKNKHLKTIITTYPVDTSNLPILPEIVVLVETTRIFKSLFEEGKVV